VLSLGQTDAMFVGMPSNYSAKDVSNKWEGAVLCQTKQLTFLGAKEWLKK